MSDAPVVLERIFGEGADRFFADHYERAPLVAHHGDPGRFADLLTLERLDRRLAELDLRDGMVELTNARSPVSRADYVNDGGAIDRVALSRGYRRGATVIVNQLQHSDKPLADMCRALEGVFHCHVQTNVYLTPPGEQGFGTHYDTHDVIVLQIHGRKAWNLYPDPADAPYRGERFQAADGRPQQPSHTFVLEAGDCAYVPRGFFHDAANDGDAPSLHITVGLVVRTWADLVLEAVSEVCLADPRYRRALPRGFATDLAAADAVRPQFAALMHRLADSARPDAALATIAETFVRTREPDVSGVFVEPVVSPDRLYRAGDALRRIERTDEGVRVVGPCAAFVFGKAAPALVERILSGEPFRPRDLDDDQALDVTQRLAAAGLVRPAD